MIKKKVLLKTSNTRISNTKDTNLSIQFNLGGFSFCVLDTNTNKTLYFSEYSFKEKAATLEGLLNYIKEIFNTDAQLQRDFSSVLVIHQNNLSAIVPDNYFNENNLLDYLNFNLKTLTTDFITFDDIQTIKAKNVYIPYVNINNYLFQNFGEFIYKHQTTIYIEKLLSLNVTSEKTVFINVYKENFDLIIIDNRKLEFCNSFIFKTKEDFIYYILFVFEQLKLDTDKQKLYFTGNIEPEDEIFKITYQYVRNIFFLESKNKIFNNLNSSKHNHFLLLGE